MVDLLAVECNMSYLSTARTAYAAMHTFDKDVHRAALATMPKDSKALVLAAQNLTMSSAAKRLKYFGEGNGRCPFCDSLDSGIIHEAWACPHFKEV